MTFVSYAQNFEDVLLWRALRDVENGRYIDIGAQDPVFDSVSLAFYELGWRGVHVEPTASCADRLRAARTDEVVVQAAVSDAPGPILFYELGGLSSGKKDVAKHHRKSGHQPVEIRVPTVRLDELLRMTDGDVHWMKIDVEGMEADVLRSWGTNDKRPWILVIESTFPNTERTTEHLWIEEVKSRGYDEAFFDGLSRYFVHEDHRELAGRLNRPANVFDGFQITANHFAAALTRQEMEAQRSASEAREDTIRAQLAEAHERIRDIRMQLTDAKNQAVAELQGRLDEANAEIERLGDHWKAEREARAAFGAELLKISSLVGHDTDESSLRPDGSQPIGAGTTYAAVKSRLSHATEELDRARDHAIRQYAAGQSSRGPEIDALNQRISSLRDDVSQARTRIGELETSGRNAEGRAAKAERDLARLRKQVDEQAAALGQVRVEAAELALLLAAAQQHISSIHGSRTGKIAAWLNLIPAKPQTLQPRAAIEAAPSTHHPPSDQANPAAQRHGMEIAVNNVRHTSNLLALNGSVFVDALYRTFLKRSADRAGREHFVGRLLSGDSKESVLLAVASSPEARAVGAPIEGIDDLRAAQKRGRGWFSGTHNARTLERKLNQLECSIGEAQNGLVERLDRIESSVDEIRSMVSRPGGGGSGRDQAGSGTGGGAPKTSIKRGVSLKPSASAAEFITDLRREVRSSAEAESLARKQ